MNRKEALDAAAACVLQDRINTYGPPEDSFRMTAEMWTTILRPILKEGCEVSPAHVPMCMIALKLARLIPTPGLIETPYNPNLHADSVTDIIGYGACLAGIGTRDEQP